MKEPDAKALVWMHAACCALLDRGDDPRAENRAVRLLADVDLLKSMDPKSLAWAYEYCCAMLDNGNDPRAVDVATLFKEARHAFAQEKQP